MPADAVILVESRKEQRNTPEYLIFVRGDKFESSWLLAKALEEFCGKNMAGFIMSYHSGISPKEFETRFSDEFSKVNVLFARDPEDLNILKKRFGVVNTGDLTGSLLENDWIEPKKSSSTLPQGATYDDIHYAPSDHDYVRDAFSQNEEWRLGWGLVIFLIAAVLVGGIWLLISYPIKKICWALRGLAKKLRYNKNRQGT